MGSQQSRSNSAPKAVEAAPQAVDIESVPREQPQQSTWAQSSGRQRSIAEAATKDSQELAQLYTQDAGRRIAVKTVAAGITGCLFAPWWTSASFFYTTAVTGANAAAFTCFYDALREALTAVTLTDNPLNSAVAGGVSGYVWNGMIYGNRNFAIGGAAIVGSLAVASHIALPYFDADKTFNAVLVMSDLVNDDDGSIRRYLYADPVLPPFSMEATWNMLGRYGMRGAKMLGVREISDEEYEAMQEVNPPFTISWRRGTAGHGTPEHIPQAESSDDKHVHAGSQDSPGSGRR